MKSGIRINFQCCAVRTEKTRLQGEFTASFQYLKRAYIKEGKGHFSLGESSKKRVTVLS